MTKEEKDELIMLDDPDNDRVNAGALGIANTDDTFFIALLGRDDDQRDILLARIALDTDQVKSLAMRMLNFVEYAESYRKTVNESLSNSSQKIIVYPFKQ